MTFHRILVGLDRTSLDDQVFEKALGVAQAFQAKLKLFHCIQDVDPATLTEAQQIGMAGGWPAPGWPGMGGTVGLSTNPQLMREQEQFWQGSQEQANQWVGAFYHRAKDAGITAVSGEYGGGDPSHAICDIAASWPADLIVLGRKGRSGIEEAFLGSVSNYVLHHAPCTVMVVQ